MNVKWIIFAWQLLSGKKTTIGAILLTLAIMLTNIAAIWEIDSDIVQKIIETLRYIGTIATGGGLAHKIIKVTAHKS